MKDQCPECFGKKDRCAKLEKCQCCEFAESCAFCTKDDGSSCDRRLGHVSYERFSYSKQLSSKPQTENEIEDDDVKKILDFLLDIDNYTAELVSEVLHGNVATASELSKKFGVSRQAIHRKLVDCCTIHPELRKLFIVRLNRCRRLLTDSRRLKSKENPDQMEFEFSYGLSE